MRGFFFDIVFCSCFCFLKKHKTYCLYSVFIKGQAFEWGLRHRRRLLPAIHMQIHSVQAEMCTFGRQPLPFPETGTFSAVFLGCGRENRPMLRSLYTRHLPAHVTQLRCEQVWQEPNVFIYLRGIYSLL